MRLTLRKLTRFVAVASLCIGMAAPAWARPTEAPRGTAKYERQAAANARVRAAAMAKGARTLEGKASAAQLNGLQAQLKHYSRQIEVLLGKAVAAEREGKAAHAQSLLDKAIKAEEKVKALQAKIAGQAAPKADAPKTDAPKADAPKADAPKADPKADAPKADAPKIIKPAKPDFGFKAQMQKRAKLLALYRSLTGKAQASGDATLARRARVVRVAAARATIDMLRAQEAGLRAKAARTAKSDPQGSAAYLAKADKLVARQQKLAQAMVRFEAATPGLADVPKIRAAADALAVVDQAPKAEPGAVPPPLPTAPLLDKPADAPVAPKLATSGKPASFGLLKAYLRNKDLGSALDVLKSMEARAAQGGVVAKVQAARARRALRKAAQKLGRENILSGGASSDAQVSATRSNVAEQVRAQRQAIRDAVAQGQMTKEEGAEKMKALRADLKQAGVPTLRGNASGYTQARRALDYLSKKSEQYKNQPVRRVISGLLGLVFGSAQRSNAKLDKSVLKEARYQAKLGANGAMNARLLLMDAKSRGLEGTWRFRSARAKAVSRLDSAIKAEVKAGNPEAVELMYQLKNAYRLETHPDYQPSDVELRQMNSNLRRAETNMVSALARQAAWIAKYPAQAQAMGYSKEVGAQITQLARKVTTQLISSGGEQPSSSVLRSLDATERKLAARKPGLLKRVAMLPLNIALMPFKIVRFLTVTQIRALRYSKTGGAPPAPIAPERLNSIMQSYLPRHQNGGAPGGDAMAMN